MNVLFILDKDAETALSRELKAGILKVLEEKGCSVDVYELRKEDASPCTGCLLCFTKHPGECFNKDLVNDIRKKAGNYSATIFLSPVLFGHYSATMSSPINKGAGSHELQVIIGCGEDINDEEKSTFLDLTARHRGQYDIVHPGMDKRVEVLQSRSPQENAEVCRKLAEHVG